MGGEGVNGFFGSLTIAAVYSTRGNDDTNSESDYPIINNTLAQYSGRDSNPETPTTHPEWQRGLFIEGTSLDTNWHVLSAYIDRSIVTFQRDNESMSGVPMSWPNAAESLTCFGQLRYIRPFVGRKKYFKFWMNGELKRHVIPALAKTGRPCMYDLVSKQTFYNAGTLEFIAGVDTLAQLYSLLAKLPDLTGQEQKTLTIRLDASLQTDELRAMIDERGEAKNWEITEAA